MRWTTERPTRAGFYYFQDARLRSYSSLAVNVVQVSKFKNREGFLAECLIPFSGAVGEEFCCELDKAPPGRWAGPLPQPR